MSHRIEVYQGAPILQGIGPQLLLRICAPRHDNLLLLSTYQSDASLWYSRASAKFQGIWAGLLLKGRVYRNRLLHIGSDLSPEDYA